MKSFPSCRSIAFENRVSTVLEALKDVDRIMGLLMDGLMMRDLHHCVNIMIISDHGMEEASCEKATFVSNYVDDVSNFTVIQGPAARIRPKDLPNDYFSFDYEGLVNHLSCRIPDQPMRPYLKENLPKRLHFANNKRIERGHLYMKAGWQAAIKEIKYCSGGFHGSDNVFANMQAIFIGYGPAFKVKTVVPPFENIELYNVMCDQINPTSPGYPPAPNNGSHGSLNHLLKRPAHQPVHPAQLSHDTPARRAPPLRRDLCVSMKVSVTFKVKAVCLSFQETRLNADLLSVDSSEYLSLSVCGLFLGRI
uniref:Ectonucleotide pyrophosphatase/phosphodiesterase 1 n=1 Tax=Salarias fasciatus TaxID=181472 RepID=A0A672HGE2_SALFA